jgi:presenilin-like A22 family membrane protease
MAIKSKNKKIEKVFSKKKFSSKKSIKKTIRASDAHKNLISSKEKKSSLLTFVFLGLFFLITMVFGINSALSLISQGITPNLFSDNPNGIENAVGLISMILVGTVLMLLIFKTKRAGFLATVFENFSVFACATILFDSLFPSYSIYFALLVVAVRLIFPKNILIRNFAAMLAIAGGASFIGIAIGPLVALVFLSVLAIYDIIAVFFTKHMLELGSKIVEKNRAFSLALPAENGKFELGNGDLAAPLIVASSFLLTWVFPWNAIAIISVLGTSFTGLVITILIASKKKIALPAIPIQSLLILIACGIIWVIKNKIIF